tara:strand:+ start:5825 stop:7738 length:1914 start_codon:yes stop_codon:yes gene_type:complete
VIMAGLLKDVFGSFALGMIEGSKGALKSAPDDIAARRKSRATQAENNRNYLLKVNKDRREARKLELEENQAERTRITHTADIAQKQRETMAALMKMPLARRQLLAESQLAPYIDPKTPEGKQMLAFAKKDLKSEEIKEFNNLAKVVAPVIHDHIKGNKNAADLYRQKPFTMMKMLSDASKAYNDKLKVKAERKKIGAEAGLIRDERSILRTFLPEAFGKGPQTAQPQVPAVAPKVAGEATPGQGFTPPATTATKLANTGPVAVRRQLLKRAQSLAPLLLTRTGRPFQQGLVSIAKALSGDPEHKAGVKEAEKKVDQKFIISDIKLKAKAERELKREATFNAGERRFIWGSDADKHVKTTVGEADDMNIGMPLAKAAIRELIGEEKALASVMNNAEAMLRLLETPGGVPKDEVSGLPAGIASIYATLHSTFLGLDRLFTSSPGLDRLPLRPGVGQITHVDERGVPRLLDKEGLGSKFRGVIESAMGGGLARLQYTAEQASVIKSIAIDMIFQAASLSNQEGRSVSDRDVARFATAVGAGIIDPRQRAAVMRAFVLRQNINFADRIALTTGHRRGVHIPGRKFRMPTSPDMRELGKTQRGLSEIASITESPAAMVLMTPRMRTEMRAALLREKQKRGIK